VPGTPEDIYPQSPQISLLRKNTEERINEDLAIYYKVVNRNKTEFGESNAESAARNTALEAEYRYLLMKKKTKENQNKKERQRITEFHALSPSTPPQEAVTFKRTKQSQPPRIKTNKLRNKDTLCHNNVQDVLIETEYSLYPTQDRSIQHQPINLIYDTGAAISMLPAECTHAWTNVRECLHTLTGCFAGHSETNLMMGEFHGILTLDSKETIRIIVPECIQIPQAYQTHTSSQTPLFSSQNTSTSATYHNRNCVLREGEHTQCQ
jgi:hypothetical protein